MSDTPNKPKTSARSVLRFLFGSYTAPGFVLVIIAYFGPGAGGQAIRGAARAVAGLCKRRPWVPILSALSLILVLATIGGYRFWLSRQPQPIEVSYEVAQPSNDWLTRTARPLNIDFRGSVAPLEMVGKSPTIGITITPPIAGQWLWESEDRLQFKADGLWPIGIEFNVTMDAALFPDHIKVERRFNFSTPDFALNLGSPEFYIDPEDSTIKRVTMRVTANCPIDLDSLRARVKLLPNLTARSGSLENRQYSVTVSGSDESPLRADLVSEPLGVPAVDVGLVFTIQRGVVSTAGGNPTTSNQTTEITVPGLNSFVRVSSLRHQLVRRPDQEFDQVLILQTRGEVEGEELLKNLEVWELPVDRPALPGLQAQANHRWQTDEMLPEVLALSRRVEMELIPGEKRYNAQTTFRFQAREGAQLCFRLAEGAKFYGGYYLAEPYVDIIRVDTFPREVRIMSEGSLLSLSGDRQLSLFSRGVGNVDMVISRIRPDDINHLVSQSNGDLANFNFSNYAFSANNLAVRYDERILLQIDDPRAIKLFSFDFDRYLETIPDQNLRHGLFIFSIVGDSNTQTDRRFIMISDLGFLVKTNLDGTRAVFVQSLADGQPVPGATVSVIGLNGNVLVSGQTGADGLVNLPSLADFDRDQKPTAYIVRRGEDLSFMPFESNGRLLDYSSFDTGGVHGATDPRRVTAFIFSDRGLYRPGDSAHFGLALKAGDWTIDLDGTPLECVVTDPRGAEVFTKRFRMAPGSFDEIEFTTQAWSPTGTYTFNLYLIREREYEQRVHLGTQTIKVEEFLPDTLAVESAFEPIPAEGWISPQRLSALVRVRNLFGTPAVGNEVKAQVSLAPGYQRFRTYRDYSFLDPYVKDGSFEEFLGTATTDDQGSCRFDIDLVKFEGATYQLRFYAEAFEKGSGRNVSTERTVFVSPLAWLVGHKADGPLGYIERGAHRQLTFIAIDPSLQRTEVGDLTFSLTERRYVSVLVRQSNGLYKYQSVLRDYPLSSEQRSIDAGGLEYALPTDRAGEFELVVSGPDGLVYNRVTFSVAGDTNIERSLNQAAELQLTADRTDVQPGGTIRLMIKAPYAGAGLITVERDKVYSHQWFRSDGQTSVQTVAIPADLEANGYITVTFIRDRASAEIFMPPMCYGTIGFSVSKDSRTNAVTLVVPAEAKPGTDLPISYSSRLPGRIVVYAVDEGILQLAGYRTPDPIAWFFRKRALEVRTAQILDLVLPEFSVASSLAATGGGGDYDELLANNLNPFKRRQHQPVVFWSGILETGPDQRTVTYRVPDHFNGSLRVMAVCVSDRTVGATEERLLIRNNFIISPNLPMAATPGDEFDVSVTITNNLHGSGPDASIRLDIAPSPHLAVVGENFRDLRIPEGRDQTATIRVKATGPVGAAELRFAVTASGERVELAAYLSVRPAVPYRVSIAGGVVRNTTRETAVPRRLYEEFAVRDVSYAWLPIGLAKGLRFYLESFPYGCSEQLVSATWPFLYPSFQADFHFTEDEAAAAVARIVGILQARLRPDGQIGIWTALSEPNPYITVYCAHFLTDAAAKGHFVPSQLRDRLKQALYEIAREGGNNPWNLEVRAYATYVLTLNAEITTSLVEALKRDIRQHRVEAETSLAGLYLAGTHALLRQNIEASTLFSRIRRVMNREDHWYYIDSLAYQSIYLNMVARHFPQRLRDIQDELLLAMAGQLEAQAYTTHSANLALLAIDAYLGTIADGERGTVSVTEILADNTRRPLTASEGRLSSATYSAQAVRLAIENRNNLNLFYQVTQAGFDQAPPTAEIKNGIEVYREFLGENGQPISSARLGDTVLIKLAFRSLDNRTFRDVALVDLLPAGLEADIASIRASGNDSAWRPDYIDIREDRLVIFGTVTNTLGSFTYRTRAINTGRFVVPPLFAEAMYDKSAWALRPQANFEISPP
ncbi:MAG: hypothetical protein A2087_00175 [Spirochaetes bacterium GWD1_61_31]|nr:MAG: hypothetical protein A2Y37_06850 [Spirochaetes bacterium GWB1_60_80]OHD30793.1 MAG: hypothetical protein A2004_04375 [Spirochaetes bacterium GWC1_61_12]OHD42963.1 MAG: hypothetical protein A2087_00175 [Spirochaetes bacterium GWD1_61_31]OHD46293.1 MAG: hypothetical protein A2Y35_07125 [Spirochaetes bacterium GWE1_60_18]OHD60900.1 MAG: hypothetical protein A2Y32_11870 [Spirochaetes bacterium GWF1_60_12]